jgi:hypothetical protein
MAFSRSFATAATFALLAVLTSVSAASAAPEQRATFSGVFDAPAGELCNFDYEQTFTIHIAFKELANGGYIEHDHVLVTHVNQQTGYTLHERDRTSFVVNPNQGTAKNVGVFWHLRTPDGKLIVVQAGQMLFDSDGNLIKITPALNPDYAAVICPALGGSPAS